MKVLLGFFFLYFLMCSALQYNDPDWYLWIPIYLYPCGVILLALLRRASPRTRFHLSWAGALLSLAGAAYQWPGLNASGPAMHPDLGNSWINTEEVRESLGLAIQAAWLAFMAGWEARQLPSPQAPPAPRAG